ncbi:hypothetical protein N0V86_002130 [Didymella sp. IMI 355093]|nr:hypothetical protein N0V86_002130 [Didymella sp. IMI 355093]
MPPADSIHLTQSSTVNMAFPYQVVRRPARGFHRFRSGVLNVTPKGLPTEIRKCVWEYALGGKTFLATCFTGRYYRESYRFAPSTAEDSNGMALLRTCRQIYSEAVLYAMNMATFAYNDVTYLKRSLKSMRPYQRGQVTHLRMECRKYNKAAWSIDRKFPINALDFAKTFPALAQITVLVHGIADADYDALEETAAIIRQYLSRAIDTSGADLIVESTSKVIPSYNVNEMDEK